MKPYKALAPDGTEVGRLLGRSQEDAEKRAREIFNRDDLTVVRITK